MSVATLITAAAGGAALFVLFALLPARRKCDSDCGHCTTACASRQGRPR